LCVFLGEIMCIIRFLGPIKFVIKTMIILREYQIISTNIITYDLYVN